MITIIPLESLRSHAPGRTLPGSPEAGLSADSGSMSETGGTSTCRIHPKGQSNYHYSSRRATCAHQHVVLTGADAAKDWSSTSDRSYSKRHAQLIASGKLVPGDRGRLRFAEDGAFQSPSGTSPQMSQRSTSTRNLTQLSTVCRDNESSEAAPQTKKIRFEAGESSSRKGPGSGRCSALRPRPPDDRLSDSARIMTGRWEAHRPEPAP